MLPVHGAVRFLFKCHWSLFRSGQLIKDRHCFRKWFDAVRIQNPWCHMALIVPDKSNLAIDNTATQGTRASAAILFTYISHKIFQQQNIYNPCVPLGIKSNKFCMTTSSSGNIFRVTGYLCRELIGHRWIPGTKTCDAELWCIAWSAPE